MQVKTWRGRVVVYISTVTSGLGAAYTTMLAMPYLGIQDDFALQQAAGIAAFLVRRDAVDIIARRIFGFQTRSGE